VDRSPHEIELVDAAAPKPGAMVELAPGVFWLRFELPLGFDHVNAWALADDDGWTLVDCGLDTPEVRAAWEALLSGPLAGRRVRRVVNTHAHPDHLGIAGELTRRTGAVFCTTLGEWLHGRVRHLEATAGSSPSARAFLHHHGVAPSTIDLLDRQPVDMSAFHRALPPYEFYRLSDHESLKIGGSRWQAIIGTGHSPEHMALFNDERRVLIAGDEVLERITPIIGVWPNEPEANPLQAYFRSLERFHRLPADTMVLPSHGRPFRGLQARVQATAEHHRNRLKRMHDLIGEPDSAASVAAQVFPRAAERGHVRLALAETIAHLQWLTTEGLAERSGSPGDVRRYRACAPWDDVRVPRP